MAALKASEQGLAKIKQSRNERGWKVESPHWLWEASRSLDPTRHWEIEKMVAAGVSLGTWKRFLAGKPIRTEVFQAFCQVLKLSWEEVAERGGENARRETERTLAQGNGEVTLFLDWGGAPDVPVFYGRTEELTELQQWLVGSSSRNGTHHPYRLIALIGMGGIGKTALAVKLVEQLVEIRGKDPSLAPSPQPLAPFDFIIWRSLHHAPAPPELLSDLIQCLSPDSINLPSLDVSGLLKALRQSRVLLILDGWEVLLGGDRAGCYRPGYELYGELLRRIGEGRHQSCLVITSREKPEEVTVLEGCTPLVKSWKLGGLGASGYEILRAKGLVEEPTEWEQLIRLYRGNPLALNVVSTTIQEFFNSKVSDALKTTMIGADPVNQAIAERSRFLSELERQILCCLAQEGKPMSIDTLRPHLPQVSFSELVAALSSLDRRSLIEKEKCCDDSEVSFTLQPVVMKYFSKRSRTNT